MDKRIKALLLVFLLGFLMNLIWENLHSVLYVHYKGATITSEILTRAALFDAAFIMFLGIGFFYKPFLHRHLWLSLIVGFVFAVLLEKWALETGRWAYTSAMPLIPFLEVGLSPAVQLGITACFSYLVVFKKLKLNEQSF